MIRLGVDFHTWDGIYQGSRSHILGLYRKAILRAPDIKFIFFGAAIGQLASAYDEFNAANVELVEMPHSSGFARLAWHLPRLTYKHRLDALHTQYRIPFWGRGAKVCTIHDVLVETHPEYFPARFRMLASLMFRYSAERATLLMTVSEYSRRSIAAVYMVPVDRITVTANGVDLDHFSSDARCSDVLSRLDLRPDEYWLTVGRLEPRKNQAALIEAWASIKSPFPLVVVGQKDFKFDEVFAAARRSGREHDVRLLESVDDQALPALYAGCHAFVYPSFAEGFGMPVLEALACGARVITSFETALPEVVGEVGVLVDPKSIESIARGMAPELQKSSAEQRRTQAEKFSWDASANEFLSALRHRLKTSAT